MKKFQMILITVFFVDLYSLSTTEYIKSFFTPDEKENYSKEYPFEDNGILEITLPKGNITIHSWKNKKLLIDAFKKGPKENVNGTTIVSKISPSMGQLAIKVNENKEAANVDLKIMVPENVKLKNISTDNGSIIIKNVSGPISAQTKSGNIEIKNAYSKVNAKADSGKIVLKQKQFNKEDSIFLETLNGEVQLYLPKNTSADIQAKTGRGVITSQVSVTLSSLTTKLNKQYWNQIKKEIMGSIGEGGAPITIDVARGNIGIFEY
ncbi:DUF4097 domain-containing protein [Candidatus Dependentiae bacterium]|nr:DUF4097 domain-containing protein [Candidatus Dependentiae bacterium]